MNTFSCMAEAAVEFRHRLLAVSGVSCRPCSFQTDGNDGILWDNLLLASSVFWHAHVEAFELTNRLSVLHVCVFPHLDDPSPIFGFDMIAGVNKVTGIFLDLSGTVDHVPSLRLSDAIGGSYLQGFSEHRNLPEWGEIFSPDILAIRPVDLREVKIAINFGLQALDCLLAEPRVKSPLLVATVSAGQERYVVAQRQNIHTFKMLAGLIGKARARHFVDKILFPSPQTVKEAG